MKVLKSTRLTCIAAPNFIFGGLRMCSSDPCSLSGLGKCGGHHISCAAFSLRSLSVFYSTR